MSKCVHREKISPKTSCDIIQDVSNAAFWPRTHRALLQREELWNLNLQTSSIIKEIDAAPDLRLLCLLCRLKAFSSETLSLKCCHYVNNLKVKWTRWNFFYQSGQGQFKVCEKGNTNPSEMSRFGSGANVQYPANPSKEKGVKMKDWSKLTL